MPNLSDLAAILPIVLRDILGAFIIVWMLRRTFLDTSLGTISTSCLVWRARFLPGMGLVAVDPVFWWCFKTLEMVLIHKEVHTYETTFETIRSIFLALIG